MNDPYQIIVPLNDSIFFLLPSSKAANIIIIAIAEKANTSLKASFGFATLYCMHNRTPVIKRFESQLNLSLIGIKRLIEYIELTMKTAGQIQ